MRVRPSIVFVLIAALVAVGAGGRMARLVMPGDKRAGRDVNRLTRIEIRGVGSIAAGRP